MLPPLAILKANEDRYVLLSLTLQDGYVDAIVVDNSKYLFTNAEWRSDGLEGQPHNYIFRRVSSRSATPKTYTSSLCKTSGYILVPWHSPIHIYTMTYSGVVLPSTYFRVFQNNDAEERWHFKKPLLPTRAIPLALPLPSKIPSHIVRGFVESAIQKKEVCPITLEPLVMGHVAMTPCGHLFEKEAVMNMLNSSSVCATCRCEINKEDLVTL